MHIILYLIKKFFCRLLDALERVSENIPIPENETSALVTQTTFAVSVQKVDSETFNGLNFSAALGNFSAQQIDKKGLLFNMMSSDRPTGSLSLPSNLLNKVNSTRVTLSVFITNALFLRRRKVNLNKIGSIVIAAGVVGTRRVENLNPPVVTDFQRNPVMQSINAKCFPFIHSLLMSRKSMEAILCVHSGTKH